MARENVKFRRSMSRYNLRLNLTATTSCTMVRNEIDSDNRCNANNHWDCGG